MLYLSAYAAGYIHLGVYRDARLADLPVVVNPSGVHGGAACSHLAVQLLGQLEQLVEALLAAHAIASGHNDGCAFQVVLGGLHVAVDHLHHISLCRHILANLGVNHLALGLAVILGLLHHSAAHGGHLRTVVGVDDGGHDVAAKRRAYLVEQVVIVLAGLLVVVVANLQLGAVGGESARERRRHAGTEVAAYHGCAHEAYLRLLLLEKVYENVGVGSRGVGEQPLAVEHEQLVNAIGQYLLLHLSLNSRSGNHGVQFHAQLCGQLAALGEQLLRHLGHSGALYLTIYEYVVHPCFIQ